MTVKTADILENVAFTEDGYLVDPEVWTRDVALAIADREGIEMTDRHWVVVEFAREIFETEGEPPTLRRITLDTDVKTKEFYGLFPGGPGKMACMIAGLEKPTGCI